MTSEVDTIDMDIGVDAEHTEESEPEAHSISATKVLEFTATEANPTQDEKVPRQDVEKKGGVIAGTPAASWKEIRTWILDKKILSQHQDNWNSIFNQLETKVDIVNPTLLGTFGASEVLSYLDAAPSQLEVKNLLPGTLVGTFKGYIDEFTKATDGEKGKGTDTTVVAAKLIEYDKQYVGEQPRFKQLLDIYSKVPFEEVLKTLPDLQVYPKELPPPHDTRFLLRKRPQELFWLLQDHDKRTQTIAGFKKLGVYLAGPNGVGKSVVIYTLACLARAHNWIVVYVPQCDAWAASATSISSKDYLLDHLARALVQNYNHPVATPNTNCNSWGELLTSGLTTKDETTKDYYLSTLLKELEEQDTHPLLLVFDEVNALFTTPLPWDTNHLAKDASYFANLAASLNRLNIKRGWKVISGTGHERFLSELASGLYGYVVRLVPLEPHEFSVLLSSDVCHPWIRSILDHDKIPESGKIDMRRKLTSVIGRVPRQLQELSSFIDRTISGYPDVPSYYKACFPREPQQPYLVLSFILGLFSTAMKAYFEALHANYFLTLAPDQRRSFVDMCFNLLTSAGEVSVSLQYLDKNLVYHDGQQFVPLTPAAGEAIITHIRANQRLLEDEDHKKILGAHVRDEAARPFERVFMKALLLQQPNLKVSKLDGTDPVFYHLNCQHSVLIANPDTSLVERGLLFELKEGLLCNTLLIPIEFSYPIADFIFVGDHIIYVFQLTLQPMCNKLPNVDPYQGIHDYKKWEHTLRVSSKDPRYSSLKHANFTECLLNSVRQADDSEATISGNVFEVKPVNWKVEYIIVTPIPIVGYSNAGRDATKFPWMRLLELTSLQQLVGKALCDHLETVGKSNVS